MPGYVQFVEKVREYEKEKELKEAIKQAIDECVEENILKEFFIERRESVMEAMTWEFLYERHLECVAMDSKEEGREEGREEGLRALIHSLSNYYNNIEDLHAAIIKNDIYADCTIEDMRKYL